MMSQVLVEQIDITPFFGMANISPRLKFLRQSIENFGLFEPIGVYKKGEGYELIYGYARLLVYKELGEKEIEAKVYDSQDDFERLKLYIYNNKNHRIFSPVEKANILNYRCYSDEQIGEIIDLLNLPRNRTRLERYRNLRKLPDKIVDALHTLKIDLDEGFLFYEVQPSDRLVVFEIFVENLGVKYNELKKIVGLLNILQSGKGKSVTDYLNSAKIQGILQKNMSNREKVRAIIDDLERRVYERLYAAKDRFEREMKALDIPRGVIVTPSKNFEKDDINLSMKLSSEADINRIIEFLHRLKRWYGG